MFALSFSWNNFHPSLLHPFLSFFFSFLRVFMDMCVYMCMYICMYMYILCVCTWVWMCTCTPMYVYPCVCLCTHYSEFHCACWNSGDKFLEPVISSHLMEAWVPLFLTSCVLYMSSTEASWIFAHLCLVAHSWSAKITDACHNIWLFSLGSVDQTQDVRATK